MRLGAGKAPRAGAHAEEKLHGEIRQPGDDKHRNKERAEHEKQAGPREARGGDAMTENGLDLLSQHGFHQPRRGAGHPALTLTGLTPD